MTSELVYKRKTRTGSLVVHQKAKGHEKFHGRRHYFTKCGLNYGNNVHKLLFMWEEGTPINWRHCKNCENQS